MFEVDKGRFPVRQCDFWRQNVTKSILLTIIYSARKDDKCDFIHNVALFLQHSVPIHLVFFLLYIVEIRPKVTPYIGCDPDLRSHSWQRVYVPECMAKKQNSGPISLPQYG